MHAPADTPLATTAPVATHNRTRWLLIGVIIALAALLAVAIVVMHPGTADVVGDATVVGAPTTGIIATLPPGVPTPTPLATVPPTAAPTQEPPTAVPAPLQSQPLVAPAPRPPPAPAPSKGKGKGKGD